MEEQTEEQGIDGEFEEAGHVSTSSERGFKKVLLCTEGVSGYQRRPEDVT